MRRVDRRRVERLRRMAITAGLSFALGALADVGLRWRLQTAYGPALEATAGASSPGRSVPPDPRPAHDPAEPRPVERPGDNPADPAPVATTGAVAHEHAVELLRRQNLLLPVEGISRDDLRDTFGDARAGHAHEAIDIMAPRHTPVRAVADGRIEKLFTSEAGGLTIYQFDRSETFTYYYAHLDRYAGGLHEGQAVQRGDIIAYVGSTGNASPDAPHLHFAIFRLGPERAWWKGEPVNPYSVLR